MPPVKPNNTRTDQRLLLYALILAVLCIVSDGWSGKPSPLTHQLLLLPLTGLLALLLSRFLLPGPEGREGQEPRPLLPKWCIWTLGAWEFLSSAMFFAEARHFRVFGYSFRPWTWLVACLMVVIVWIWASTRGNGWSLFLAILSTYAAGVVVAIRCFPLNYLRSDMLPVIGWADDRIVHHLNPYTTMHVGNRLYDFPYMPGMLVAFWPAAWLHIDLRWANLFYLALAATLIFAASQRMAQMRTAGAIGLFVLSPFLQYRHDLYLEPHWFTLVLAVVLMDRRRYLLSATAWGASCAIYQLSWVIFPFVLLNAYRRRGIPETLKMLGLCCAAALSISGPFLASAAARIASNTVGQWSRLPHALADPINLSYWLTYIIRPDQLKWVQAAVLVALFAYCFLTSRCRTLADTLRWSCCALAIFIPLNVIVDGYFYLTLALLLLLYLCSADGWWRGDAAGPEVTGIAAEC